MVFLATWFSLRNPSSPLAMTTFLGYFVICEAFFCYLRGV